MELLHFTVLCLLMMACIALVAAVTSSAYLAFV